MKALLVLLAVAISGCVAASRSPAESSSNSSKKSQMQLILAYEQVRSLAKADDPEGVDVWQTPQETLMLQCGDCEDHAILLAWLWNKAGITDHRLVLGVFGPHGWHLWNEITADGETYIFDATLDVIIRKDRREAQVYQEGFGDWHIQCRLALADEWIKAP